jgi:uncharacterized protein with HEPN domain
MTLDPALSHRLAFLWLAMRQLRNQMVHEYVEDPAVLAGALASAHGFVPSLLSAVAAIGREVARRGWHAADARP